MSRQGALRPDSPPPPARLLMSKLERLYHLHDILKKRRMPASRQLLMEELGCSQATLYRLVQTLRDQFGAPLEQDEDTRGFYYDRTLAGGFELPGIWISPEELQALLTARQILSDVQPGLLEDELEGLQHRITSLLDTRGLGLGDQPERIHIRHDAGRAVPARMFEDVLKALFQRKKLQMTYHGRRRNEKSQRLVSPQRMTSYRDRWYLDGWCHTVNGLRSFALERIIDQQVLDEPAVDMDADELKSHHDQAYGIFSGPAEHLAVLLFTAESARWAADEIWHADQNGEWLDDGRFRLTVPFGRARELVMDILRYGPDVRVEAPEFLVQRVAEQASETALQYSG